MKDLKCVSDLFLSLIRGNLGLLFSVGYPANSYHFPEFSFLLGIRLGSKSTKGNSVISVFQSCASQKEKDTWKCITRMLHEKGEDIVSREHGVHLIWWMKMLFKQVPSKTEAKEAAKDQCKWSLDLRRKTDTKISDIVISMPTVPH